MTTVAVSYKLDLGPELPADFICIARRQGEDPDKICALLQELKDMIYGKVFMTIFLFSYQLTYIFKIMFLF